MLSIKFETSERGDSLNWVKGNILDNGFGLLSFEGYTVKDNLVSLLLDRGCFETEIVNIDALGLFKTLNDNPLFHLKAKIEFARRLGCDYLFFCYSYVNEKCCIFILEDEKAEFLIAFESYNDFANWTRTYRDLAMHSLYQESGLPELDIKLRKLGIPWPGNLDYALLKDETITALIEFQRTSKLSVAAHCNNTWFLPKGGRKGDVNRWRAIDIIRQQCGLPLLIIVWSDKEEVVKLKQLEEIIYPEDPRTPKGLIYRKKEVVDKDRMIKILNIF